MHEFYIFVRLGCNILNPECLQGNGCTSLARNDQNGFFSAFVSENFAVQENDLACGFPAFRHGTAARACIERVKKWQQKHPSNLRETAQLVKCSIHKLEDLSSIPRTHRKGQAWWACNPSIGEAETIPGPWGQPASPNRSDPGSMKDSVSKRQENLPEFNAHGYPLAST